MASKRKRSVMSLEKKLDIITQIRQGRSQRAVADGFGVAKSTVGDIWKNREKIEIHVSAGTNPAFAKKRCIVRDAHFHKLDEACYIWFQQQRAKGAPSMDFLSYGHFLLTGTPRSHAARIREV